MNNFKFNTIKDIVFMGATQNIFALYEISQNLNFNVYVITSPDQEIEIQGLVPYVVFDKLDDTFAEFIEDNCSQGETLFISLGARWIFKKDIIENIMCSQLVNFHGTRLPYDAGGGGYSWRILKKDRIDSQLVHLVDEGIDTGPILKSSVSVFPSSCKIPNDFELYHRNKSEIFFKNFLVDIKNHKEFYLKPQLDYIGSYNPRLMTNMNGWINWAWESSCLVDFIDAFDSPYQGASTLINGQHVRIKKAQLHGGEQGSHPYMSGIIFRKHEGFILVSTGDQFSIIVEHVEDENGLNILDNVKVGDRFYTDNNRLLEAVSFRALFGSTGLLK